MTYNLLNYPGSTGAIRNPYFITVLSNTEPDIIVAQELISQSSVNEFVSKVLMQISTDYDGGLSWEIQLTQINGGSFRSIVFANKNNGWSAGEFTDIWHTTNGGVSFVDSIEIYAYPNDFVLSQNYPNPFNPTTKIKFEIPTSSVITLKIYDVLGRELKVLIDEYKTNGKHEIVFDGSEFPSGVYFYKLQGESFVQTKKMLLLK